MQLSLSDGQQAIAHGHCVTNLDADTGDRTGLEGANLGFHLHGLKDYDQITFLHGLAWLYQNLENIACKRSRLGLTTNRSGYVPGR